MGSSSLWKGGIMGQKLEGLEGWRVGSEVIHQDQKSDLNFSCLVQHILIGNNLTVDGSKLVHHSHMSAKVIERYKVAAFARKNLS